ncbi:MAG: ADP-ribosylglycohydrolase family protein [Deltaproteobacteria bacterium]|nr:ADP-ribosylglycohydrolase family protein [Deltaproteobacteria bacterium]
MRQDAITGCILGTAVGDALGLPYEGLTPKRAARLFKEIDQYHFFLKHGMVSDDTEHTCLVAQSLIIADGDPGKFIKDLSRRLRYWLLGLPGGVGFATLRSILKLWMGFSPEKSGVYSAGNGPAMRSAVIGVAYGSEPDKMKAFVRNSTIITHSDPKAYFGALGVALAAHMNAAENIIKGDDYIEKLRKLLPDPDSDEFIGLVSRALNSSLKSRSTKQFAEELKLEKGITGYIYHTVPMVIHSWLTHPKDFRSGVLDIISCGGDTDTTAAILGGIIGAGVGKEDIPGEWLDRLWEWPRTVKWMEKLAKQLKSSLDGESHQKAVTVPFPLIVVRNLIFTIVILMHGFRRMFPPY